MTKNAIPNIRSNKPRNLMITLSLVSESQWEKHGDFSFVLQIFFPKFFCQDSFFISGNTKIECDYHKPNKS